MLFSSAANKVVVSNAGRGAQAAAVLALEMAEEKNELPELAPSSSIGTTRTASVSNVSVANLAEDISNLEVQIVAVEREIDEVSNATTMTGHSH